MEDYKVNTVHIHIPDDVAQKYKNELQSTATSQIVRKDGHTVIASEFSFQEFFDKVYDAILIVSEDGVVVEANYRSTVMFGQTKRGLIDKRLNTLIPSMDGTLVKQLQDNAKIGLMSLIEISCVNSAGMRFPTEIAVNQLECSEGFFYIFSIRNVTRRVKDAEEIENAYKNLNSKNQALFDKQRELLALCEDLWVNERELLYERDLLHTLMSNMPEHIFFKDAESRYLRVNDSLAKFMGLKEAGHIEGRSDFDFYPEELAEKIHADELEIMDSGVASTNKEQAISHMNGEVSWLTTSKVPVYDENGDCLGLVGISRDDTASVETRELMKNAKLEAEEANRIKSDFLANITHELKTPLNPILGLSSMISRDIDEFTQKPEELKTYVDAIQSAAKNLQSIIDDLLIMVQKDHKFKDDTIQEFKLSEILTGVYNLHSYDAHKHSINFVLEDFNDCTLRSDYKRLHHILSNFISNAIKFTPEQGEVVISVRDYDDEIWIAVKDNGVGIKERDLEHVFERFVQVEDQMTRSFQGTGLGLAIVEEMSSLIGVKPFAESEFGEGSEFGIAIPKTFVVS